MEDTQTPPPVCASQFKHQSGKTSLQRGTMEGGWWWGVSAKQRDSLYMSVGDMIVLTDGWDVSRHFLYGGNNAKRTGMLTVMCGD